MNTSDEAIVTAVEEVSSVAEELKRLRDKIKQYADASQRLNDIGSILEELNSNVGRIRDAFTSALQHVVLTQAHAKSSQESVEKLVSSVPVIIARIEASDAAATAQSLADAMNSLGGLLRSHEKSLEEVASRFTTELAAQAMTLHDLRQRVDVGVEAVGNLASEVHGLHESTSEGTEILRAINSVVRGDLPSKINTSQKCVSELRDVVEQMRKDTNQSEDSTAEYRGKVLGELALLRVQLDSASKNLSEQNGIIQRQGVLLDELSKKKKGWFA
ncbi:hypothetical protein CR51_35955 [Caballeronia megalochromosomata]|nr:hypothetical protein CR51_35955 [Caballeronia megalochromosomata]